MATKALIYGAGSIGNHLSHAGRRAGWEVTVTDISADALARMRDDIYPKRYGAWDDAIVQKMGPYVPEQGEYDVIMVGTPPDFHVRVAQDVIAATPKILHIEKVLATPLDDMDEFSSLVTKHPDVMVTVGYDHVVAPSVSFALSKIKEGALGDVLTIDSRTLEHWGGIFAAHPWLSGPHDSYLGFLRRGGGALCEHSHALHLGMTFAEASGWGSRGMLRSALVQIERGEKGVEYDQRSDLSIFFGERMLYVTQDVLTKPTRKELWAQGTNGRIELSLSGTLDTVTLTTSAGTEVVEFKKTRPDDFFALVSHYDELLSGRVPHHASPVRVEHGIQTMRYIQEAFRQSGIFS